MSKQKEKALRRAIEKARNQEPVEKAGRCRECKHAEEPREDHLSKKQSGVESVYCTKKEFDVPGYYSCDLFKEEKNE